MLLNLGDGDLQVLDRHRILGAAVDEKLGRAGRISRDQHPLENLVRNRFHQRTVHERARVALVGVADQNLLGRILRREEAPLRAGRETAAPAAAQARKLDFVHYLGRRHRQRPLEPVIAAVLDVILEAGRVDPPGQRQNLDQLLRLARRRNLEPVLLAERKNIVDIAVFGLHIAVKNRIPAVEHDFDHRLGIAVPETAGAFDRNRFGTGTQEFEHRIGARGHAAACDADPDLLDFRLAHLFSYSFRILIMLLRSSFP